MTHYRTEEIKRLLSESLREKQDGYVIQELFQHFPTASELLEASEQQLVGIKGIGKGKARQIIALLQLAKTLTVPTYEQYVIRCPQDI